MTKGIKKASEVFTSRKDVDTEWRPAPTLDQLEGLDTDQFAYRWVRRFDINRVKRFEREGWSFVNETDGDHVYHKRSNVGALDAGSPLTSEIDFREVVLMKLPADRAEARRRYYQQKTAKATGAVNRDIQSFGGSHGTTITPTTTLTKGNAVTVID